MDTESSTKETQCPGFAQTIRARESQSCRLRRTPALGGGAARIEPVHPVDQAQQRLGLGALLVAALAELCLESAESGHRPGDHQALDLVRALVDLCDLRV